MSDDAPCSPAGPARRALLTGCLSLPESGPVVTTPPSTARAADEDACCYRPNGPGRASRRPTSSSTSSRR